MPLPFVPLVASGIGSATGAGLGGVAGGAGLSSMLPAIGTALGGLFSGLFGGDGETDAQKTAASVQQQMANMAQDQYGRQVPTQNLLLEMFNSVMGGGPMNTSVGSQRGMEGKYGGSAEALAFMNRTPDAWRLFQESKARNPKWTVDEWARTHYTNMKADPSLADTAYWGLTRAEDLQQAGAPGAGAPATSAATNIPMIAKAVESSRQESSKALGQTRENMLRAGFDAGSPFMQRALGDIRQQGAQQTAGIEPDFMWKILQMIPNYLVGQGSNVQSGLTASGGLAGSLAQTSVYQQQVQQQPWNALLATLGNMDFPGVQTPELFKQPTYGV